MRSGGRPPPRPSGRPGPCGEGPCGRTAGTYVPDDPVAVPRCWTHDERAPAGSRRPARPCACPRLGTSRWCWTSTGCSPTRRPCTWRRGPASSTATSPTAAGSPARTTAGSPRRTTAGTSTASRGTTACTTCSPHGGSPCRTATRPTRPTARPSAAWATARPRTCGRGWPPVGSGPSPTRWASSGPRGRPGCGSGWSRPAATPRPCCRPCGCGTGSTSSSTGWSPRSWAWPASRTRPRFLEAARRLGATPAGTVVVEDAVAGVEAGRRGGFGLVVGVARTGSPAGLRAAGADAVVGDLGRLVPEPPLVGTAVNAWSWPTRASIPADEGCARRCARSATATSPPAGRRRSPRPTACTTPAPTSRAATTG